MRLFRIVLKEPEYDNYRGFMVASTSISNALEEIYKMICLDEDGKIKRDIPYCLRSSNMNIECIGEFTPTIKLDSPILLTDFYNA